MLLVRLWCFFAGYLIVKVEGKSLEKFINMAVSNGIFLWDIQRKQNTLYFKITLRSFLKLHYICRRTNCRKMEILRKSGLPFLLKSARRRKLLFAGGILFIIALYVLSSMVWFIEVKCEDEDKGREVLEYCEELGLKRWKWKDGINKEEVAHEIKNHFDDIAWAGITVVGTKVTVEIVEKVIVEEEKNSPGNVIAQKDGIIYRLLVLVGQPLVKEGDTVVPGQILISGAIPKYSINQEGEQEIHEYQLVPAKGIVEAKRWYESYGECPLQELAKIYTGVKHLQRVLKIGDAKVYLQGKEIPFEQFDTEETVKTFPQWRNIKIPVELLNVNCREYQIKNIIYTKEEAIAEAKKRALSNVKEVLPENAKILNQNFEVLDLAEGNLVRVRVVVEVVEEIGEKRLLE